MERYDLIIIGTGPAGISAAITAKIRKKSFLLIGSAKLSEKVQKAHTVSNYPGLGQVGGAEMQKAFLDHLAQMEIAITEDKITLIYPMGDYFALQGMNNAMYESRSIILAAGMAPSKMLPGEEEMVGRGVSYCATCDAPLYKGKSAIVVAYSPEDEHEADFMAQYASKVLYFPQYKQEVHVADGIEVIREVPKEIRGGFKADTLVTSGGEYKTDGIFILRESVMPSQLVPGLEMEEGHVAVKRDMSTNIPGLFACGDITGKPYQYIKAAGEGNVAALSMVNYLDKLGKES